MEKLKSNFLYNTLFTGINLLFPFISLQYVLHKLGPIGIGKSQFAFSFAQYFTIIAAVGIPVYGVREAARYKKKDEQLNLLFTELIIINGITCLLLSVAYLIIVCNFDYFKPDRTLYITGVTFVFFSFMAIEWLYTGLSTFKPLAIRSVVIKSVFLILILIMIKSEPDYFNYFLLNIGAIIAGNFINIWLIRHEVKLTFKGLNLKKHIVPLLLVFGVSVGSSMYTVLDTVLLGFLTQAKFVGLYTCAVKFAKMAMPLVNIAGTVLMPEISKRITHNDLSAGSHLLEKSFQFIVFFSIPVSVGSWLLAPEFILIFSGSQFTDAVSTMQILAVLPFFLGMGYFFSSQILFSAGRYQEVFIAVLVGIVSFVALNFILVPRFKHNGAAIANIASELVVTIAYIYFVYKHYTLPINLKCILTAILSSLLFFPVVYMVRSLNLSPLLSLCVAAIGCVTFYLLSQWLIFKDHIISYAFTLLTRGTKQGIQDPL